MLFWELPFLSDLDTDLRQLQDLRDDTEAILKQSSKSTKNTTIFYEIVQGEVSNDIMEGGTALNTALQMMKEIQGKGLIKAANLNQTSIESIIGKIAHQTWLESSLKTQLIPFLPQINHKMYLASLKVSLPALLTLLSQQLISIRSLQEKQSSCWAQGQHVRERASWVRKAVEEIFQVGVDALKVEGREVANLLITRKSKAYQTKVGFQNQFRAKQKQKFPSQLNHTSYKDICNHNHQNLKHKSPQTSQSNHNHFKSPHMSKNDHPPVSLASCRSLTSLPVAYPNNFSPINPQYTSIPSPALKAPSSTNTNFYQNPLGPQSPRFVSFYQKSVALLSSKRNGFSSTRSPYRKY